MSDATVMKAEYTEYLAKAWGDSIRRRLSAVECQLLAEGMPAESAKILAEAVVTAALNDLAYRNWRGPVMNRPGATNDR